MPAPKPPRDDRDLKAALAREARLYGLGLVCATPAALAVWRTGSLWVGVLVFLAVLGVAGSALFVHERKRAARRPAVGDGQKAVRDEIARGRARLAGAEQSVVDEARRVAEQQRREQHAARQRSGATRRRGRDGGRRR